MNNKQQGLSGKSVLSLVCSWRARADQTGWFIIRLRPLLCSRHLIKIKWVSNSFCYQIYIMTRLRDKKESNLRIIDVFIMFNEKYSEYISLSVPLLP